MTQSNSFIHVSRHAIEQARNRFGVHHATRGVLVNAVRKGMPYGAAYGDDYLLRHGDMVLCCTKGRGGKIVLKTVLTDDMATVNMQAFIKGIK